MRLHDQHVLVFGGGGFIGRHVVEAIVSQGGKVTAMDLHKPADIGEDVDWVVGSLADTTLVSSIASGCSAAIYLAGHSLPASANANVAEEVASHVIGAVKTAEICASQGVERFVFSSSGGTVYGTDNPGQMKEDAATHPKTAYGVSKLAIEHYLRVIGLHRGMKTVSLRIANPYGVGQKAGRSQGFIAAAMSAAINGETLSIWGDGSVVRDFIYVEDVAEACLSACTYSGPYDLFNIGRGEGASLREVVDLIEVASGKTISLALYPDRPIDVQRNVLDITRASEHLGWVPRVTMQDGLAKTSAWWTEQLAQGAV